MSSRRRTNKFVGQRLEILFDDNVWCTGMICEHSSIRDNYGIYFDCDRTMCTYKLGHVRMNCSHKWPIRIITAAEKEEDWVPTEGPTEEESLLLQLSTPAQANDV
jgi:hypothetical protein